MLRKFIVILLTCLGGASASLAAKKPVTIDAVMRSSEMGSSHAGPIIWAPNGSQFVVKNNGTLAVYDVPSGKQHDVTALRKLEDAAEKPEPSPVFDWTNRRVGESDVQWFANG